MRKKGNKIPNVLWNRIENYTMHICDKFGYLRQHSSCLFSLHYWPWLHVRIQSMRIKLQLNFRFVIFLYRKVKTLSYLRNIISTETVCSIHSTLFSWISCYKFVWSKFPKIPDFILIYAYVTRNWHMLIQFVGHYSSKRLIRLSLNIHEYTMWVELI